MYESFFGFQRPPFELVPDPDFLFLGESHDSALANLVMGLESGRGFVVITGPVGAGKTTILRAMLRRIGCAQNVCFLSQPEMEVGDLLRAILEGFGVAIKDLDLVDMRRTLRDLLTAAEKPGVLIVDEAHLLTEETLEQLRLLSNLEEDHRKLLQIVFSGQLELTTLLSLPRLRPLAQRIEMFYEIKPLSREETQAYIDRRIRIAGNPDGLVIEPRAFSMIHTLAGGIPRLINILADRALITAYVESTMRITEKIVREAYDDLGQVTQSLMPGGPGRSSARPSRPAAGIPDAAAAPAETPAPAPTPTADPAPLPPEPAPAGSWAAGRGNREWADRWFPALGVTFVFLVGALYLGGRGLPTRSGSGESFAAEALEGAIPVPGAPETPAPGAREETSLPAGDTPAPETERLVPAPPGEIAAEPAEDEAGEAPPGAETGRARPRERSGPGREPVAVRGTSSAAATRPEAGSGERPATMPKEYAIYVKSFADPDAAKSFSRRLREETGEFTRIRTIERDSGDRHEVLLGQYRSRSQAVDGIDRLHETHDFPFLRLVLLYHPEDWAGRSRNTR